MKLRLGGRTIRILLLAVVATATARLDAEVRSFAEIVGHDFGERITVHHEMEAYLEYLAQASPRVAVVEQGRSWEGRRLLLAVVTSADNHQRLTEIKASAQRLADPRRTSADEAARIVLDQPAILYLGGSIHGFELSGAEGVLKLLQRLATGEDEKTLQALANTVVLLDPMLNPDGRDAFAHRNHGAIGREPSAERDDWSNDFNRWEALRFRTGHYYFDTNRDWWAHTQNETRYRVPSIQEWRPQVIVDLHEMSPDVEFYFDPPADPFGVFFPDFARRWFVRFGQAYAGAFDLAGFEYMTRERFNYFYPGYTTSYGSYQGAVGMLYEQGSSRGLALERADLSVRRLSDAIEQQYTAAWTAVQTAASARLELLHDYFEGLRLAVADGERGTTRYLFGPAGDPGLVAELADLLLRNGIEVGRLGRESTLTEVRDRTGKRLGSRTYPAGTFVVEAAQPRNRLVRALLEPAVPLPEPFVSEARARLERGEDPRFYDITAWSLPLLFNLPAASTSDNRPLQIEALASPWFAEPQVPSSDAPYAYVFDGRQTASLAALAALKRDGFRVAVTLKATRIAGHDLSSGSVVVRVGQNDANAHTAVRQAARHFGLELLALASGLSEPEFPALGSGEVLPVRAPEVALLAGDPVQAYSFGWAWFTLDRQYEIPVTVRRVRSIESTPLHRFNVLVIPHLFSSETLAETLGEEGVQRLQQWVRDGGSLVALGSAVDFVRQELDLGGLRSWYEEQASACADAGESEEEDKATKAEPEPQRFEVPGAFLRVTLDPEAWLAAGYGGELPALVTSSNVFLTPEGPPNADQRVVARYASADNLLLSGHLWTESRERLAGSVFAFEERIGRGRIILFAEDLNFRGYWRGANRLFLNAVLLGPSAP
jgi:hypothetical protein